MTDLTVTEMSAAHIADVAEIEQKCFSTPWTSHQLSEHIASDATYSLVCLHNGTAVGYVGSQIVLDEMYITNIAVLPEYRRHGIASRLFDGLLEKCHRAKISFISLEVRQSNAPAKAFYTKYGFVKCGERKNFYQNPPETAEIMTLKFNETEDLL